MTPADLLAEADRLLTTVVPGTRGWWPRACARLTRLALEQALDDYWPRVLPEAVNCGVRPQLLMLPRCAGANTAEQAAEAWYGLARATHHHAYDLAPTAAELRRLARTRPRCCRPADCIRPAGRRSSKLTIAGLTFCRRSAGNWLI
jgi:hypothetical protein